MLLKSWRKKKRLSLVEAAKFLGIHAVSTLSDIERGVIFPGPGIVLRIQGATSGRVTQRDHFDAWCSYHPDQSSESLAAGRAAAKAYRSPAKSKK